MRSFLAALASYPSDVAWRWDCWTGDAFFTFVWYRDLPAALRHSLFSSVTPRNCF